MTYEARPGGRADLEIVVKDSDGNDTDPYAITAQVFDRDDALVGTVSVLLSREALGVWVAYFTVPSTATVGHQWSIVVNVYSSATEYKTIKVPFLIGGVVL